jgi:hypothetical protein
MFRLFGLFLFLLMVGASCVVDDCPVGTKELLERVLNGCGTTESCAAELQEQLKLIMPTDAAEKVREAEVEYFRSPGIRGSFGLSFKYSKAEDIADVFSKRDKLMRIPRDFDGLVEELAKTTRAVGDFEQDFDRISLNRLDRYWGNYTMKNFVAHHSGTRLLRHLKACLGTCVLVGRSCSDIFGPAVEQVEQKLAQLQLRPFWDVPYYAEKLSLPKPSRIYFDQSFDNKTCPGLDESSMRGAASCRDWLTDLGLQLSHSPDVQLLEKVSPAMERAESLPGALEEILKISHQKTPTCFFSYCLEQNKFVDTMEARVWDLFYNLTGAEVAQVENDCLGCWEGCMLKCRVSTVALHHNFQIYNVDFSAVTYIGHLCNTSESRTVVKDFLGGQKRVLSASYLTVAIDESLPQRLDLVLGLIVSVIVISCVIALVLFGGKTWRDFKMGVYILGCVTIWSLLRIIVYSVTLYSTNARVQWTVGGDFAAGIAPTIALLRSSIMLGFWVNYFVMAVQIGLLSLLLYQWLAALLADEKYAFLRKIVRFGFVFACAAIVVSGLGLMIYFTLMPTGADVIEGEFSTMRGMTRRGRVAIWFSIAFSYILVVLLSAIVCCALGLVKFHLEGHNKNAVIKSLVIFILLRYHNIINSISWSYLLFLKLRIWTSGGLCFSPNCCSQ